MDGLGIAGTVLMENAGRGATDAMVDCFGPPAGKAVAIIAGSGNNAGDGFVVARHLALRGAEPIVFLLAEPDCLAGDAAVNFQILQRLGLPICELNEGALAGLAAQLAGFDWIVDAVGGTGIRGALRGELAEAVRQMNAAGRPIVALDIPSGLDCDTGEPTDPTIIAQLTVTFAARKKGFDAPSSQRYTGEVHLADIGVPVEALAGDEHAPQT